MPLASYVVRCPEQAWLLRGGMPWETSKSFDHSCPCGIDGLATLTVNIGKGET